MLAQLTISNFAIVRELEIGSTAAWPPSPGKPAPEIHLPSTLGLCLGGRAGSRHGASRRHPMPTCARASRWKIPCRPALAWKRISWRAGVSVYFAGWSAPTALSRGFINGTAVPLRSCASWASYWSRSTASMPTSCWPKPEHQNAARRLYRWVCASSAYGRALSPVAPELPRVGSSISSRARSAPPAPICCSISLKSWTNLTRCRRIPEQIDEEHKRPANSGQLLSTRQHAPYGTGGRRRRPICRASFIPRSSWLASWWAWTASFPASGYAGRGRPFSWKRGQRRVAPPPWPSGSRSEPSVWSEQRISR